MTAINVSVKQPVIEFEYFRSHVHLRAVRALPCCICGATLVAPAHSQSAVHGAVHGHGGTTLASDEFTIPLCGKSHLEYDPSGYRLRSEAWFLKKVKETAVTLRAMNRLLPHAELLLIERGVL